MAALSAPMPGRTESMLVLLTSRGSTSNEALAVKLGLVMTT